jgi:hypothetical protein
VTGIRRVLVDVLNFKLFELSPSLICWSSCYLDSPSVLGERNSLRNECRMSEAILRFLGAGQALQLPVMFDMGDHKVSYLSFI